jgi:hypothetical protein
MNAATFPTTPLSPPVVNGDLLACPHCRRWCGVLLLDATLQLACRRCRNGRTGVALPEEG